MENKNEISTIVLESGLGNPQADFIISKFKPLFEDAEKLINDSKNIVVTDVGQSEQMAKARNARRALQTIRISADNTRKELKEDVTKYGRVVQGIYNLIEEAIVPAEKYLEKQEKFAILLAEEKAKNLKLHRISEISKYVSSEDLEVYNFDIMTEETFVRLLTTTKALFEAEKEKEVLQLALIEKARVEKEAEDKRVREENEALRKEKEENVKREASEKAEREAKELKIQLGLNEEKKKQDDEKKKIEDAHKKELDAQRIAKEKVEAELKRKQDEEKKEQTLRDNLEKEKQEKERQANLAPEKEKLFAYSESIRTLQSPEGLSKTGLKIVALAQAGLLAISQQVKENMKDL